MPVPTTSRASRDFVPSEMYESELKGRVVFESNAPSSCDGPGVLSTGQTELLMAVARDPA
jgi:hypothetical protein